MSGLTNIVFTKVMQCTSAKQAWDKLKLIYEGESKVKEENIGEYLRRVDEVVNAIRVLGGKLKEKVVVSKVLRTLLMRYNPKVSTL